MLCQLHATSCCCTMGFDTATHRLLPMQPGCVCVCVLGQRYKLACRLCIPLLLWKLQHSMPHEPAHAIGWALTPLSFAMLS
jgi:hypothetical protein